MILLNHLYLSLSVITTYVLAHEPIAQAPPRLYGSVVAGPASSPPANFRALASSIVASLHKQHSKSLGLTSKTSSKTTTLIKTTSTKKTSSSTRKLTASTKKLPTSTKKTSSQKKKTTSSPIKKAVSTKKSSSTKRTGISSKKSSSTKHVGKRQATFTSTSPASSCTVPNNIMLQYVPADASPEGFLLDPTINNMSSSLWIAPAGYNTSFTNRWNATESNANNYPFYLGVYQLASYDPNACANLCDAKTGCSSFNIYYQRSPLYIPDAVCTNPAGVATVNCALYGNYTNSTQAGNYGQWRSNFLVMISGSNGYNKIPVPNRQFGFTIPQALAGALNYSTALSTLYYPNGIYDPDDCAARCYAYSASAKQNASANRLTTFTPCNYYNTYSEWLAGTTVKGSWCMLYKSASIATATNVVYYSSTGNVISNLTSSFGSALYPPNLGVVSTPWVAAPISTNATCSKLLSSATSLLSIAGNNYTLGCSYDVQYAADIGNSTTPDFYSCINSCDNIANCDGFAYLANTCYFKKLYGIPRIPILNNYGADMAWKTTRYNGLMQEEFVILSAYFGYQNITSTFLSSTTYVSNTIVANTTYGNPALGVDNWTANANKVLTFLYKWRNETRVFAAFQSSGVYTIQPAYFNPSTAPLSSLTPNNTAPASAKIKIAAIEYGGFHYTNQSLYTTFYQYYAQNTTWRASNTFFGNDPAYGKIKSAVVWYYTPSGALVAITGQEDTDVRFIAYP